MAKEQETKTKTPPDPEVATLSRILRALNRLEPDARERIGQYLAQRFGPKKAG